MNEPVLSLPHRDDILRTIEMTVLSLAQSHHLEQFFTKIPRKQLDQIISKTPSWFSYYDASQLEVAKGAIAADMMPGMKEAFGTLTSSSDPFAALHADHKQRSAENITAMTQQEPFPESSKVAATDEELSKMGAILAFMRSLTLSARSLAYYGQPINELMDAGKKGNDRGFLLAATIDPTIVGHPAVAARSARSHLNPHDTFDDDLKLAATKGPKGNIEKDHGQLRIALYYLRSMGLLAQWSDEQKYQVFCHELKLYADTGENPKAALRAFINRWEKSLVI